MWDYLPVAKRGGKVHVATTRRHYNGKEYKTTLLRRSYREGGKVRNETVGNLSHLEEWMIDGLRAMLAGRRLVATERPQRWRVESPRALPDRRSRRSRPPRTGFDAPPLLSVESGAGPDRPAVRATTLGRPASVGPQCSPTWRKMASSSSPKPATVDSGPTSVISSAELRPQSPPWCLAI